MNNSIIMYYITLFMLLTSVIATIHAQGKYPGFVGPRGKRNDIIYDDEPFYTDISQLQNDDLLPLVQKKSIIFDVGEKGITDGVLPNELIVDPEEGDFDTQVSKRAMGFQGVRGKKDMVDQLLKRAMGFQGVRGKKDTTIHEILKKAMGFQGVRGKKYDDNILKRAMGFHGVRGKKINSLAKNGVYWQLSDLLLKRKLYEIRGKKGPSSNAFMAMRGKKSLEKNSLTDLANALAEDVNKSNNNNNYVIDQSGSQNEEMVTQD